MIKLLLMKKIKELSILDKEIKKGGRKTMKEIKVIKTMYETIDGRHFETQAEATNHEMNLEYHKDIISFARRIKGMWDKYVGYEEWNSMCGFKRGNDSCIFEDASSPCDWKLSDSSPS